MGSHSRGGSFYQSTDGSILLSAIGKRAHIGNSGDTMISPPHPLAEEQLKVGEHDLDEMVEELKREEEKVASFFNAIQ